MNEKSNSVFLEAVFEEIFALSDGTVITASTNGWVPDVVSDKLRRGTASTSRAIIGLCRTDHVIDETLRLTLLKLHENWDQLKPDRKAHLIALIRNHRLEGHFEPYMLTLSPTDEEGLLIRWDAADILFNQEKEAVFRRAHIDEKGRRDLFSLGKFDEVLNILLTLLRHKADYDLSAVVLGAHEHAHRYIFIIVGKCQFEYFDYLLALRDLHRDFLVDIRPEFYGPGGTHRGSLSQAVEADLETFKKQFEVMKESIPSSIRNQEIFERMVVFTRDHPSQQSVPREVKYMKNIVNYGQFVETGDIHDFTNNNNFITAMAEVDLPDLVEQLRTVQSEAQKRAASTEQTRSVLALAEAADAAEKGERHTTAQKLAATGKWVLDIAKELGASVVAKLIEAQLGMS